MRHKSFIEKNKLNKLEDKTKDKRKKKKWKIKLKFSAQSSQDKPYTTAKLIQYFKWGSEKKK